MFPAKVQGERIPMYRVGNIVLHSCIRAHKIGWGLKKLGHNVVLFSENMNHAHAWWDYDCAVKLFNNPDNLEEYPFWHLKSTLETIEPLVDIWHCHNEPDWIVPTVREVSDKPIIYDIHDLRSAREGTVADWEKQSLEKCDGISVVSDRYKQKIYNGKPIREILSCVPEILYPQKRCKVQQGGVVYEGGLGSDDGKEFSCRNWAGSFKKILKTGTPVWAYAASSASSLSQYRDSGVMVLGPFRYDLLIGNLTSHDAGLVGSPVPDPMFDGAMPNKLFEYLAAGLPIIAFNAGKSVEEFILATGIGAIADNLDEIPDILNHFKKEKTRDHVWEARKGWSMESQMPKVVSLYDEVFKQRNAKDEKSYFDYSQKAFP